MQKMRFTLEFCNFKLSNRIPLNLQAFWMIEFRTCNFGSSFQVHILSLSYVVILEGKCFKTLPNQSFINSLIIIRTLEAFFQYIVENSCNG